MRSDGDVYRSTKIVRQETLRKTCLAENKSTTQKEVGKRIRRTKSVARRQVSESQKDEDEFRPLHVSYNSPTLFQESCPRVRGADRKNFLKHNDS